MNNAGIAIAVAFSALTGVGGFFLGRGSGGMNGGEESRAPSSKSAANSRSIATKGVGRGGSEVEPNMRGYDLSKNPRAGLETLLEELRQSPMAQMDFEALFGIWDMLQYLDGSELEGLMAELEEMGGGQEMMAVRMMLLNRWAVKDGPAAMESIFEGKKGMMQMVGAMGAMMGWMRSAPEQAYTWFQENGDRMGGNSMGMGKDQIEAMYFASMAKTDFDGTMAKLDGMDRKMQKAVIEQLSQSAVMDVERRTELLDYLKRSGDESLLKDAQRSIVNQMTWHDPKGAIAFIESEGLEGETKVELLESVTSMWSHSDPQGSVEYMSEELKGRENAGDEISSSFGQWVGQDEAGAAEWLAGQPEEFQTDSLFRSSSYQLMSNGEYERSAEWSGQILDEGQRQSQYQNIYREWSEDDQSAADDWKASLPVEEQAVFTEKVDEEAVEDAVDYLVVPEN